MRITGIVLIIVLFGAYTFIIALSKGNIGGPGIDIAVRELFRKKKKKANDIKRSAG